MHKNLQTISHINNITIYLKVISYSLYFLIQWNLGFLTKFIIEFYLKTETSFLLNLINKKIIHSKSTKKYLF